ncbi:ComEA family DNA-binding protein [Svornostia abyssi]|uniref:ComEA family DNA-binding protein n=2 Tax=Svornostia abyssi TaxID=2898438 RepID=A0ABY5PPE2_9ACTN|nr:ComEA family DNA-binding protein [Parviterribacteraceae bacterium J379]
MLAARDPGGGGEPVPAARAQTVPKVAEAASSARVIVHVAGRVRRPGVYRLREGARVDDAVQRAGGALGDADLTAVNLAAEVEDGRQVVVPAKAAVVAAPGAAAAPGEAPAQPLNLNTATSEQLQELDGVGPGIAAKILAYRQEHGGFGSVKELGDVPGIGEKRLAALEASVTV